MVKLKFKWKRAVKKEAFDQNIIAEVSDFSLSVKYLNYKVGQWRKIYYAAIYYKNACIVSPVGASYSLLEAQLWAEKEMVAIAGKLMLDIAKNTNISLFELYKIQNA